MSSGDTCRECGAPIPADSPGGFCAQCLLALGLQKADGMPEDIAPTISSHTTTEKPGDRIGRYRLLQEIGHGGCGVVYMAEQEEPVHRRVALKVIKLGMDTRQVIARFEAERQALALMDHPNIAKVLDAGATEAGRPYFVMELVRGVKITEFCDDAKLPTRERLNLFIQVCRAVQHAHQKGVIHRDIKPSNILLTVNDGVPVPKVIDFGIAKATGGRLTDKTLFTAFEQFMGTPAYMSPEQAVMTSLDIDTRSDIYSLGVLLYELLTGKTPFDANELLKAGLDELRRTIREQEPVRPSTRVGTMRDEELTTMAKRRGLDPPKLIQLLRGDLDWIVMKCLEKHRSRRYDTANGLGRDIERHLNNEPVMARPPSTAYRVQKFVGRNKVMVTAVAAIAVVLVLGIVGSAWQAVRAVKERQRAEGYAENLRQTLYIADTAGAWQSWAEGDAERTRERLDKYRPATAQTNDLRGFEWRYLWGLSRPDELFVITNPCVAARYSPDGHVLAISSGTTQDGGIITLWDTVNKMVRKTFKAYPLSSWRISFSPDGKVLATVSRSDPDVKLWDVQTGDPLDTLVATNYQTFSAVFSPDAKLIATVACKPVTTNIPPVLKVWDAASRRELFELKGHRFWVANVDFSPDSKFLASADGEGIVKLWDLESQKEICSLLGHSGIALPVKFSPIGKILATADERGTIILWDWAARNVLRVLTGHQGPIYDLAISRDGKQLASAGRDHTVRLWDLDTGEQVARFLGHFGRVWTVDFSPDGHTLATTSEDKTVRFWRGGRPKRESDVSRPNTWVGFSPDGRFLFEDDGDNEVVTLKDMASFAIVRSVPGKDITFSGDGGLFAIVRNKTNVVICETDSLREIKTIKGTSDVSVTGFSPNGRLVVLRRANRTVIIDLEQIREVADLGETRQEHVFTPDSKHFLATDSPDSTSGGLPRRFRDSKNRLEADSSDTSIRVWDVDTWKVSSVLRGHRGKVNRLALSPDGQTLASGSDDTTVRLWDMKTRTPAPNPILQSNSGAVLAVAFSPDGKTLAAGNFDGPIELWSVSGRQEFGSLKGHFSFIQRLQFSPDGCLLLSQSYDGTMRLWRAPSSAETDAAPDLGADRAP